MNTWYYRVDGEIQGPCDDEQLKALCDAGVLNISSKVWRLEFQEWVPISETDFKYKEEFGLSHNEGGQRQHQKPFASDVATSEVYLPEDDLSMWQYFTRAFQDKYADFQGRARRKEYWSFILFYTLIVIGITMLGVLIDQTLGNFKPNGVPAVMIGLLVIFNLATLLPSLAILVRRMHDINISGWIILISLVPYIGNLIILVLCIVPSSPEVNKYGPPPV